MYRARRSLTLFAAVLLLLLQATAAFAAPSGWTSVDVTQQSEQQQSMLLVSGELPPEATLPAEAELAVPAGSQLQWIGEILGGDPSKDPELQYTKTTAGGMDVYRFTLTKARIAQVEAAAPTAPGFDGTNYATALTWTAWQSVPEVRVSQRIPQGAQIVQAVQGASVQPGEGGYSYYTKTFQSPEAGEVLDLSFSYALPAGGSTSTGATSSNGNSVAFAIFLLVVVAGLGLVVFNVNKKMAAKAAPAPVAPSTPAKKSSRQTHKPAPVETVAPQKKPKPIIPMLIVVGVFIAGFALAGAKGTSAVSAEGRISRDFGAASPCQSAQLPFTIEPGVDLASQGEQLLKGFEGMEGVGQVTIDIARSTVEMAWCESSQSEESMRGVLNAPGLIEVGQGSSAAQSAPTTATLDASGDKQTATVDTSGGSFSPKQLVLAAGVPAEIAFGAASGCLSEVIIGDLGVNQDLTPGPATVKLPALEAGTYTFACAMGHQSGELVVR